MKSVKKAFTILELFLSGKNSLSLSEISKLSGLHKAAVYRFASFLTKEGYLYQREKRGNYYLGMKLLDFSGVIKSSFDIKGVVFPYLIKLNNEFKETVIFSVCDGKRAIIMDAIHASSPLRFVPREGVNLPLHSTSAGKIFLADMTKDELKSVLRNIRLKRYTQNTITNFTDLKKHLIIVRQNGIAFDQEENIEGLSSIATGIKERSGNVIGVICVAGPVSRLSLDKLKGITPIIKNYALEISRKFGWNGE